MAGSVTEWLVQGVGLLLVAATLLPYWRSHAGLVRSCDFPRMQIACAIPVVAGLLLLAGSAASQGFALGLGLCLALQVRAILPFTPLARRQAVALRPEEARPEAAVTILIANVLESNRDYGGLLREAARVQPDLILALETDQGWRRALAPLEETYPHVVAQAQDNTYGLMLYSRLPLERPQVRFLLEDDVPSIRTRVVLRSGDRFTFHGVHPRPPHPGRSSAPRDAELVLVAREVEREGGPTVVAGDLNDVAWSSTTRLFQTISGLLDPRRGRGAYATFNARWPFLRWPLDHVFFSEHFLLGRLERLPDIGSDHFPILISLQLDEARGPERQDAPEAGAEERARGRDAVAAGREEAR
ncbi:MAG: endonuclease/exonuclease/phosphatase family protein [Methylobacterium frigidaeris]